MGIPHIATGDLFRSLAAEDNGLGREVRAYMNKGEYVPDDVTIRVGLDRLRAPDTENGCLLDGFPRTVAQATALTSALGRLGQRVDLALYITAPEELLVRRLSGRIVCHHCNAIYNNATRPPQQDMSCDACGHELERREDERAEVVRTRLRTHEERTSPVAEYYRERGTLVEIHGARTIEVVEQEVDGAVGLRGVR